MTADLPLSCQNALEGSRTRLLDDATACSVLQGRVAFERMLGVRYC